MLRVENLRVAFPAAPTGSFDVVGGIGFAIEPGETVAFVGESGCGKSMTALSLMRLVPAPGRISAASLAFRGTELLALDDEGMRRLRGQDIAMIFQDPMTSLNPTMTIGRQIAETIEAHLGLDRRAARRRTVDLLERVGISDAARRADVYPHALSGGMRQRVMIALAISCDPALLIADEPTTALDVTVQAQILELLAGLSRDRGMALMLITHDLGVVARYAHRVNVMYGGEIVETEAVDAIFAARRHPYTAGLLGCAPHLDGPLVPLQPMPGAPPDLRIADAACRFRPRCTFAEARCATRPPLIPIGDGAAACWRHAAEPAR
jgi:oligopeptide/dipeptide ABC transporter ATP-binding protein